MRPTVLVDGFVAATWSLAGSTLSIAEIRPLTGRVRAEVAAEGERLVEFASPGERAEIRWTDERPEVSWVLRSRQSERALRAADTEGPLPGGTE